MPQLELATGQQVWYDDRGSGPAVVLLHAGGADHRMWDGVHAAVAAAHRTLRVDLPGAGESPYPRSPWGPTQLLDRLLDTAGVERAAMVGVSLGGGLAVDYAIERPARVWALVPVASGPRGITDIPLDPRVLQVFGAVASGDRERAVDLFLELWAPLRTDAALDARIHDMVAANIGLLAQLGESLVQVPGWPATDRLGEIGAPTLVVWGDADEVGVRMAAQRLVDGIPGARAEVLPGVDHFVPMRAPDAFTAVVLPFLDEVRPR